MKKFVRCGYAALSSCAAAAAISMPAVAQTSTHWNGLYGGLHAGYGWGTAVLAVPSVVTAGGTTTTGSCQFGKGPIVSQVAPPAGSLFKSVTGNQRYPAAVANILGLTAIGGGYYQATTPVGFDFRDSTGFPDTGCMGHQVYFLNADGNYYGGRRGVPALALAGFPADFVPSDSNGTLIATTTTTPPSFVGDLGPFSNVALDPDTRAALANLPGTSVDIRMNGFIGGAQAGYNLIIIPGVLVGVEADITFSTVSGARSFGAAEIEAGIDWFGTARGRLGTVFENWLVYMTAGLAYGDNHVRYTLADVSVTDHQVRVGWTAGAGIEIALDRQTTLKGEYKYLDFGEASYPGGTSIDVRGHFDLHTVIFGVNKRF